MLDEEATMPSLLPHSLQNEGNSHDIILNNVELFVKCGAVNVDADNTMPLKSFY